jgi:hypothetical protein
MIKTLRFSQERVDDETAEEEFKRYKDSRFSKGYSQSDAAVLFGTTTNLCLYDCWYSNVLGWWKVNESNYPRMAAFKADTVITVVKENCEKFLFSFLHGGLTPVSFTKGIFCK